MPRITRDIPDTSSYWAAVWTMCAMPDVHVICDAPIGCFNLVATAIPDYTDAVPHIENITPSVIRDAEVGGRGTSQAVQRTYEGLRDEGLLEGKRLIVVSTAESELIGSDLTDLVPLLKPGTTFFHSESLTDDEWLGRDRTLQWLWERYGAADAAGITPEPGLVNIIGPTYGCFNAPSDLEEIRRVIEGAGGRINLVYPYESRLSDTPGLAKAAVNVVLYKEFGATLATTLGQPWAYAPMGMQQTTDFLRQLGAWLGTSAQAEAFIRREKRTTLRAVWDLWRGPQSDWFPTLEIGIVATSTYADGLRAYFRDELGIPVAFAVGRPRRAEDLDTEAVRARLHTRPPTFVFGSINERIYLAEGGARGTHFIPAAFPGAVVRRAVGTPFMGYRGAVYVIQEIVNHLYDTLFNFLPVDGAYAKPAAGGPPAGVSAAGKAGSAGNGTNNLGGATGANAPGNLPWAAEAKALLDRALDKVPFLARISASRDLQMRVEAQARAKGLTQVPPELAADVLGLTQE
jgi:chlorophyllide a reductase subunit Z